MIFFTQLQPWIQSLILSLFLFALTTLGSSMVFFVKRSNKAIISFCLALSSGIMIASAIFSLILPSIEQSELLYEIPYLVPTLGVLAGGLFVVLGDVILNKVLCKKENYDERFKRNMLLFFAISLHNIPEGMCVGVAVAAASSGGSSTLMGAIMLAFGIGIQNFPEGASVALPLLSENMKKRRAFLYGSLSGFIEPIACVLACLFAMLISQILPFLLAFSAGAMLCVSCTELISEASSYSKNLASLGLLIGFFVMMILDLML